MEFAGMKEIHIPEGNVKKIELLHGGEWKTAWEGSRITDLTGTKWKLKTGVDMDNSMLSVDVYALMTKILGPAGGTSYKDKFACTGGTVAFATDAYKSITGSINFTNPRIQSAYLSLDRWTSYNSSGASTSTQILSIDIRGGTAATNQAVIAWFEANATLVQ